MIPQRILDKIDVGHPAGCWQWTAAQNGNGYGVTRSTTERRQVYAHRYMWEALIGPIPAGMHIDHLCRNRGCCNPDHLRVVTPRENSLAGEAPTVRLARAGKCIRGHVRSPETAYQEKGGAWQCRVCRNERQRERYQPRERKPRTHCKYGHEFTPDNTYLDPKGKGRHCRTCRTRISRERWEAQKSALDAERVGVKRVAA